MIGLPGISEERLENEFKKWLNVHLEIGGFQEHTELIQNRFESILFFGNHVREDLVDRIKDEIDKTTLRVVLRRLAHELSRFRVVIIVAPQQFRQNIFLHTVRFAVHFRERLNAEHESETCRAKAYVSEQWRNLKSNQSQSSQKHRIRR